MITGSPWSAHRFGYDENLRRVVQGKLVEQQSITNLIMAVRSFQMSWLYFYFAAPQVSRLLRAVPRGQAAAILRRPRVASLWRVLSASFSDCDRIPSLTPRTVSAAICGSDESDSHL